VLGAIAGLLDRLYLLKLRRQAPGLSLAPGAVVDRRARIVVKGPQDRITLGRGAILRHGVYLSTFGAYAQFGDGASIGPYTVLYAQGGLTIGRDVSIGPQCVLSTGWHHYDQPGPIRPQGFTKRPIVIGDDVLVGAHVTVVDGVTIGDEAVIAAGALVRSDVPRGAVYGGVPARLLSWRPGYEPATQPERTRR
jgi:acetyltransferase-like isoleucine patch superfamily enzyme